jgi:D-beta-D-heptose 7-phosphate kinase/D-beta-D-heptose 1-phosphate adenosyltransferase
MAIGTLLRNERQLKEYVDRVRKRAEVNNQDIPIIWTNGCYDLLHIGHAWYLHKSKGFAPHGVLIVGVNTDDSIKRIKGDKRPIMEERDRAELLCYLEPVDAVYLFEKDTPQQAIEIVQPDIIVKGEDWKGKVVVGQEVAELRGGRVELAPLYRETSASTTAVIEKVLENYCAKRIPADAAPGDSA